MQRAGIKLTFHSLGDEFADEAAIKQIQDRDFIGDIRKQRVIAVSNISGASTKPSGSQPDHLHVRIDLFHIRNKSPVHA